MMRGKMQAAQAGQESDSKLLTTASAARRLDITPATVRQIARAGRLPFIRTDSGQRLFRVDDVEQLAREREQRAQR